MRKRLSRSIVEEKAVKRTVAEETVIEGPIIEATLLGEFLSSCFMLIVSLNKMAKQTS